MINEFIKEFNLQDKIISAKKISDDTGTIILRDCDDYNNLIIDIQDVNNKYFVDNEKTKFTDELTSFVFNYDDEKGSYDIEISYNYDIDECKIVIKRAE